jgi:flagellar motor protein MotB
MKRHPLSLVGILALGAIALGGCGSNRDLEYKNVQIKELERRNAELEAQLAAAQTGGQGPVAAAPTPTIEGTGDINVGTRDQDVVLSISNEVLFKPGSAVLSDRAKKVLDDAIAKIKATYPDADVRVEGHTDNQPIKRSKDEHKDNWDLAGNRAQAVLHYLLDHGIEKSKLGFAGYGMERPLTSNGSESGKAKNRRVEIVVIKNGHQPAAE